MGQLYSGYSYIYVQYVCIAKIVEKKLQNLLSCIAMLPYKASFVYAA